MHLMIFDPHERGHYLSYVRYLLRESHLADRVTLVLRQGIGDSAAFKQQLASCLRGEDVDAAIAHESYHRGEELARDFREACRRWRPDHVWVPSGDLLVRHAAFARVAGRAVFERPTEVECGIIEARFHRKPRRWRGYLRNWVERALLTACPWSRLHTVDPTLYEWAQSNDRRDTMRLSAVPDPVDDYAPVTRESARIALGLPRDGRYVVSVGVHEIPRKGSMLLLQAFARARLGTTDRLLLAGPTGGTLHRALRSDYAALVESGRVILIDRYLDTAEIMASLSASDLVCTPYADHYGSSAIVLQSAHAERPVLAPRTGWFEDIIPRFGLGTTGDILDATGLSSALEMALERARDFRLSASGRGLARYSAARNFGRLWAVRIRQRLRLPADEEVIHWESVVKPAA